MAKHETELKAFFTLIFHGLKHDIWPGWCHQRSPEAGSGIWILRKPNKVISILTGAHINHDQIHHTWKNWLGLIFFSPGDIHKKGMLFLLHWVLKVPLRLIYGEGRTQIAPSSSATVGPLPKVSIERLYWSKWKLQTKIFLRLRL